MKQIKSLIAVWVILFSVGSMAQEASDVAAPPVVAIAGYSGLPFSTLAKALNQRFEKLSEVEILTFITSGQIVDENLLVMLGVVVFSANVLDTNGALEYEGERVECNLVLWNQPQQLSYLQLSGCEGERVFLEELEGEMIRLSFEQLGLPTTPQFKHEKEIIYLD